MLAVNIKKLSHKINNKPILNLIVNPLFDKRGNDSR